MHNKANTKWQSSFFILVLLNLLSTANKTNAQTTDFEILYDTVIVYDTVWEYETIYNTVVVYDTIFIDTTNNTIHPIHSIKVNFVYYSPFAYESKSLAMYHRSAHSKPKLNRSKFHRYLYNKKHKSKIPSKKKSIMLNKPKLTLNPQKGKFNPQLFRLGLFSFEPYAGVNFQNITEHISTTVDSITYDENSTKGQTGIDYGIKMNYNLFQYGVQTGIGISMLRDIFSYTHQSYLQDSTLENTSVSHIFSFTDSIQYIDTDKLLQGDTVWITHHYQYDSLITYDSIYYTHDSTLIQKENTEQITHTLLEVPIIFSYEVTLNKTAILLKFGGVNQFHLYTKGKTYTTNYALTDINKVTHYTKYNFALYASIGLSHQFSKHFYIGINAFYKHPLFDFSKSLNTYTRRQTYGIQISLKYLIKNY